MWVANAASSANKMSLKWASQTFVLASRRVSLNSLPSDIVHMYIPPVVVTKARFKETKKIPKSVGAKTQSCLISPRMSNGPEELLLNCTVPFMLVWKDSVILSNLGGQPIFVRTLNRPSLLFSVLLRIWRRKKTMSTFDLSARKPHCDSG